MRAKLIAACSIRQCCKLFPVVMRLLFPSTFRLHMLFLHDIPHPTVSQHQPPGTAACSSVWPRFTASIALLLAAVDVSTLIVSIISIMHAIVISSPAPPSRRSGRCATVPALALPTLLNRREALNTLHRALTLGCKAQPHTQRNIQRCPP